MRRLDWHFVIDKHITGHDILELRNRATPHVRGLLQQAEELIGVDPFQAGPSVIDVLKLSADGGYIRSAATVWDDYEQVCFRSAADLKTRVQRFLTDEPQRQAIAESMRKVVIDRFTYRTTSAHLLDFVADDLAGAVVTRWVR